MNPKSGESYNIGGDYTCKVGDILNALLDFSEHKDSIKVTVDPDRLRPIDADLQIPDTSKFTNHTGWKPIIPYRTTILDLLNYWRDKVTQDGDRFLAR